ncbi:MAG: VOC family protein [Acidobacteriota bacterium]|nr:VOC family protein [Acidobacteriota bacterium]
MYRYVEPTRQLVVEVLVRDLAVSRAFYERLGFEVIRQDGSFLEVAREGHLFFLAECPGLPPAPDVPTANVRVMVPDADRWWTVAREMGARVVAPIGDRDYGLRDFTIVDPDGFGLRFASWL